jgi:hypothetical protein
MERTNINIDKPENKGEKEVPASPLKREENCLIFIRKSIAERMTRIMLKKSSPNVKSMIMLKTRAANGSTERESFSGEITFGEMIKGLNSLTISNRQINIWAKSSSDIRI